MTRRIKGMSSNRTYDNTLLKLTLFYKTILKYLYQSLKDKIL
jgi:hypothetical protein